MRHILGLFLCISLWIPGNVSAGILLDFSPSSSTDILIWGATNKITEQRFAERVSFQEDVVINGIAIYMPTGYSSTTDKAIVSVWDGNTSPNTIVYNLLDVSISAIDFDGVVDGTQRVLADISSSPMLLKAYTPYWIGMTGPSNGFWTQTILKEHSGSGSDFGIFTREGFATRSSQDMAFQLYGGPAETNPTAATPEPGTMLLMGIGAAGVAFMRRRKAAKAA